MTDQSLRQAILSVLSRPAPATPPNIQQLQANYDAAVQNKLTTAAALLTAQQNDAAASQAVLTAEQALLDAIAGLV